MEFVTTPGEERIMFYRNLLYLLGWYLRLTEKFFRWNQEFFIHICKETQIKQIHDLSQSSYFIWAMYSLWIHDKLESLMFNYKWSYSCNCIIAVFYPKLLQAAVISLLSLARPFGQQSEEFHRWENLFHNSWTNLS